MKRKWILCISSRGIATCRRQPSNLPTWVINYEHIHVLHMAIGPFYLLTLSFSFLILSLTHWNGRHVWVTLCNLPASFYHILVLTRWNLQNELWHECHVTTTFNVWEIILQWPQCNELWRSSTIDTLAAQLMIFLIGLIITGTLKQLDTSTFSLAKVGKP